MMHTTCFTLFFLSLTPLVRERGVWKIELFNGESVTSNSVQIEQDKVFLKDTVLSKEDVKSILFIKERREEAKTLPEDNIKQIIEEGLRTEKKFPDAGGIIITDYGRVTLRPDGTRTYQYHFVAKILKHSKKEWANVRIYFEEDRAKVTVTLARTIKPDGTVFNLPEEEIRIVKPKSGMVFFKKDKSVQFELPNVSTGDIIEYKYTQETFNPWNKKIFNFGYYFQTTEPVGFSSLQVAIPDSLFLKYGIRNMEVAKPETWMKDGYRYYRWEMHDVEPVIEEPQMPPIGEVVPRVRVSTVDSWDSIFDWYRDFQLARMKVTHKIEELAKIITEGAKTKEEKVANLYHFVQRNVRYISIKGGAASGVSGHPAEETLEKGYGDCTDKAILFATLLKAVGIEAYPIYVGTNDDAPTLMTEVPSYYGNHCINEVKIDSKSIYLDATGTTSRYPSFWSADHDVYAINAIERKIEKTPIPRPSENERKYEYEMTVSSLDCEVIFRAHYTGDWEDGLRWYYQHKKEEEIRKIFEEMIHEISPYSELIDYSLENVHDISRPFGMVLKYRLKNYLKKTGDLLLFELPDLVDRYTFDEVGLGERKFPISYSTSRRITHSYTITFPKEFKVAYLPDAIDSAHFTHDNQLCVSYAASFVVQENVISFRDDFKRYKRVISAPEYKNYKEFLTRISLYAKKRIVFQEESE